MQLDCVVLCVKLQLRFLKIQANITKLKIWVFGGLSVFFGVLQRVGVDLQLCLALYNETKSVMVCTLFSAVIRNKD